MTSDAEHRASMASRVDGASLATGTPMPVEALGLAEVVKVDAFGDWIARSAGDVPGAPRSSLTAAVRQLPHASIPFVERVGDCAVGSVVIPDGGRRSAGWERFAFLVSGERLVVVEAGDACEGILRDAVKAASAAVDSISSPVGALAVIIRTVVRDHPAALSGVREDLERCEEVLLEGSGRLDRAHFMADMRRLIGLDGFYQGLGDLCSTLAEDGEGLVDSADRLRLERLARQLDRLSTRLESLEDYGLQVHSLYQETIDVRQNSIMQWLTVVATIAMPLTFITSWYGMNFKNMFLLNTQWGYLVTVAACAVIAAAEIAFFHRRGWLSFGRGRRRR